MIFSDLILYSDANFWKKAEICYEKPETFNKKNFCTILNGFNQFFTKLCGQAPACLSKSDFFNPLQSKFTSETNIIEILKLTLAVAIHCDQK